MWPSNLTIILVILGLLSFIINAGNAEAQEKGFDFWGAVGWWIDKIAGPLAIIVAIIIFLLQQRSDKLEREKDETDRMSNSCEAMLEEIRDHRDAFTNPEYEHVEVDQETKYTPRRLVTDAYDSLLYSGLFNHFERELQNSLSNLYLRIKFQNELLTYMDRFSDTFFLYDNSERRVNLWRQKIRPYLDLLVLYQKQITDSLDGIEILIQRQLSR